MIVSVDQAVVMLLQGDVIVYPTESVFGLGGDPNNDKTLEKIIKLKQRDKNKGLILVAADQQQLENYIDKTQLSLEQQAWLNTSWPGAITWILPIKSNHSPLLTGRFNTLAVRVSAHPVIQALCRKFNKPIVSTSANLATQSPARKIDDVIRQFGDIAIVAGELGGNKNPSEIRHIQDGQIIRKG